MSQSTTIINDIPFLKLSYKFVTVSVSGCKQITVDVSASLEHMHKDLTRMSRVTLTLNCRTKKNYYEQEEPVNNDNISGLELCTRDLHVHECCTLLLQTKILLSGNAYTPYTPSTREAIAGQSGSRAIKYIMYTLVLHVTCRATPLQVSELDLNLHRAQRKRDVCQSCLYQSSTGAPQT